MADSCSLKEAAGRIGVTEVELRRHIDQGAFPGRFLNRGPSGVETRLPLAEVEAFARLRGGPSQRALAVPPDREVRSVGTSVGRPPLSEEAAATRRLFLEAVDYERSAFFDVVRRAWIERDDEVAALRREVEALREEMRDVFSRVERAVSAEQRSVPEWRSFSALSAPRESVDVEALFREIGELEALFGVDGRSN